MTSTDVGVQLYSVRAELTAKQLPRTLDRLAAAGVTQIEPFDIVGDTAALARALDDAGLDAMTAHAKITELDRDVVLEAALELGVGTIIVPMAPAETFAEAAAVDAFADTVNDTADEAAARGIHIGYHNHDFEFGRLPSGQVAYDRFVSRLDPRVVLELDAYWASVGGADPFEVIRRLVDRVRFLHLRDDALVRPGEAAPQIRPVAGVDTRGRLAELVRTATGLELPVVEVVVHDGDVWPLLERTIAAATRARETETVR